MPDVDATDEGAELGLLASATTHTSISRDFSPFSVFINEVDKKRPEDVIQEVSLSPSATEDGGVDPLSSSPSALLTAGASDAGPGKSSSPSPRPPSVDENEKKERRHVGVYKYSPLSMIATLLIGIALAIGHHLFYHSLNGVVVGSINDQQWALRYGTSFAFLTQVSLIMSTGIAYTQWLYLSLRETDGVSVAAIDAAMAADQTILALFNLEFLQKVKIGALIALIAWLLQLPSLVTPATLSVSSGLHVNNTIRLVPSMNMTNATISGTYQPRRFAYYVPTIATEESSDIGSYVLLGPRTIISRLSAATATSGQILTIIPPFVNVTYDLQFYGPKVSCTDANSTITGMIDYFLEQEMANSPPTAYEVSNAYFAFVPDLSEIGEGQTLESVGKIPPPVLKNRMQQPAKGSNEVWMAFKRYADGSNCENRAQENSTVPHHLVCRLYNASYHIHLEFVEGNQTITDINTTLLEEVSYPKVDPLVTSDLVQYAYSGVMWAFTDQLVGSMGFFTDNSSSNGVPKNFSEITTDIEQSSLLGSSDLDVFFDQNHAIYSDSSCTPTDQRLADISLAKNRTLDVLIEELSFNTTISLMSNTLISPYINTTVQLKTSVNLYAYRQEYLLLPYGLAILLALIANILGGIAYQKNGVSYDRLFSSFLSATRDPNLINLFHYQSLGKLPVPDSIRRTLLIFGKLNFGDLDKPGMGFMNVGRRRGSRWKSI